MKLLIAGSRDLNPTPAQIQRAIDAAALAPTELVSGGARGVDRAGEVWARQYKVPVRQFIPDWANLSHNNPRIKRNEQGGLYDANAGHRRNKDMARYADAAIIFWDGKSPGTRRMIIEMKALSKPYWVIES